MRCVCCNKNLNDWESTVKHAETGEYLDTCRACLTDLNIPTIVRSDLESTKFLDYDTFDTDLIEFEGDEDA